MPRGAAGCAKTLFFPHPAGMDEQCAAAAEEQHHRPEQIPEHLCRPGESHGCDIGQQIPGCTECMDRSGADPPPGPDKYILGGKAQCIQRFSRCRHCRVSGEPAAKVTHMVLGLAAQPVPVQQPNALQLCPKGAQFLPPLRFCGRGALLLRCLIFDQKVFLLPCRLRCAAMHTSPNDGGCLKRAAAFWQAPARIAVILLYTLHALKQALSQNLGVSFTYFSPK